ncbi:hypothetical protein PACTADRAFT_49125 [Pachysolen tannophilus NRRL Y-2460]|uniref:Aquaporin n=1 Tax=Pachysolen tannophilus NRRL Y-2460 TaxID=669874 RepID=A0A1E4U094_PACTA|nr:hypothetical protein PACTADRAFT_49125 [Pachysolen tannophilus NRRL Y-2460]
MSNSSGNVFDTNPKVAGSSVDHRENANNGIMNRRNNNSITPFDNNNTTSSGEADLDLHGTHSGPLYHRGELIHGGPATGLEYPGDEEEKDEPACLNAWSRFRYKYREYFAEFFGTMIMVMFGDGVVAQSTLSDKEYSTYTNISLGWGGAVMLGYMTCGGISGGHLNPAVTFASAVYRDFKWSKTLGYMGSQMLGGYIGGLLVYATYKTSFDHYEGGADIRTVTGDHPTAGIFCTFAQDYLPTRSQITSELVSSTLLQFLIFALTDPYNLPSESSLFPFSLFMLIFCIGACYGYQTGYAINPARDLAPRVAAASIHLYGSELWTYGHNYAIVPSLIPFIGTTLGGFLYDTFIYRGLETPCNQADYGYAKFFGKLTNKKIKTDLEKEVDST